MELRMNDREQVAPALRTVTRRRPRFEGVNICTWIGFKHLMYLVEEGVLDHLRETGAAPRMLFEQHGLCVEIVDSQVRILHALHLDDLAEVEVTRVDEPADRELRFQVVLWIDRAAVRTKAVTAKVAVVLKVDDSPVTREHPAAPPPAELAGVVVPVLRRPGAPVPGALPARVEGAEAALRALQPQGANVVAWRWRIPYYYCHYTERLQHSGYVRLLEEAEDRFLAARGISIHHMLHAKRLIPAVPRARVEILAEAYMEEELLVAYTLEDVFKEFTYDHRMDCYVVRDGALVHTATGRITHGYTVIENREKWGLVSFDEETLRALKDGRP